MENKTIVIKEDNKLKQYEVIIEFTSNITNKNYIAYTDGIKDELNNLKIYISYYEKDDDIYILNPITNQEEINMVNNILNEIKDK